MVSVGDQAGVDYLSTMVFQKQNIRVLVDQGYERAGHYRATAFARLKKLLSKWDAGELAKGASETNDR